MLSSVGLSRGRIVGRNRNYTYDTKWQFCSYWHQIDEVVNLKPENVLHVGVGTRFLDDYLKKLGLSTTSVDIDSSRNPEVAASVADLPFLPESFDVVACFEVLEHLPFELFSRSLKELWRVAKRAAVLSLPDVHRFYICNLTIPYYGTVRRVFTVYTGRHKNKKICDEHFWEVGLLEYPLSKIRRMIEEHFHIDKEYRVFEKPYHRFFVLQKKG